MRTLTILILLILLILLIASLPAIAQNRQNQNRQAQARAAQNTRPAVCAETLTLYEPGEFKGVKYRLMKPIDFDANKTCPLILSLHGAGGRGTQNIKNLCNWNEWLADETLRRKHPAFVLVPQSNGPWIDPTAEFTVIPEPGAVNVEDLPEGMRRFGGGMIQRAVQPPTGNLDKVLELIDTQLAKRYKIDADRVYCLGHSLGGMGTFTAVYQHPDRFAAAIPSAGAFYPWQDAARIKDIPLWIFHSNDDPTVDYICSKHPFERLKKLKANAKFATVTGVKYASNTLAFNYTGDEPEKGLSTQYGSDRPDKTDRVWDWLFRQER